MRPAHRADRAVREALTYFVLTFAISWGGVWLVAGVPTRSAVKAQDNPLFPLAVLVTLAGPSVSGVLLTALCDGVPGLRTLWTRLLTWRFDAPTYALALLTAPSIAMAVSLSLSVLSPVFRPGLLVVEGKTASVVLAAVMAVSAGFFEELGWTGFALPRLRRLGPVTAGLVLGLLWSAWHVPVVVWGIGDMPASQRPC